MTMSDKDESDDPFLFIALFASPSLRKSFSPLLILYTCNHLSVVQSVGLGTCGRNHVKVQNTRFSYFSFFFLFCLFFVVVFVLFCCFVVLNVSMLSPHFGIALCTSHKI